MSEKNNKSRKSSKVKVAKEITQKEKYINPRNYLYAILILVGGILLTLYIFKWYQIKQEEKLMTSYLISTNTVSSSITDLNSLKQITQEVPSNYFIYLGYTNDIDEYNLEKDLKKVIDKYKLNDIFYYIDITKIKNENDDYLEEIADSLEIEKLENVPAMIYVVDGKINERNILDGVNNTTFKVGDLEELLDIYDFDVVK